MWSVSDSAAGLPACVVDARLALSRHGQLSVARLARSFAVWMPQQLQRVLHETRSHINDAAGLTPRPFGVAARRIDMASATAEIAQELAQWDRLPEDDDLAGLPLYYLGERADECFIPPYIDRRVRERCEQLQRGVYRAMSEARYDLPRGAAVSACIADAAALCGALQPYGAFILTRLEDDAEQSPALCNYLDAWGIHTVCTQSGDSTDVAWLHDALARSGLAPVWWSGIHLAVVHVLVAGFPALGGADRGLDDDAVARLWKRASVYWHKV